MQHPGGTAIDQLTRTIGVGTLLLDNIVDGVNRPDADIIDRLRVDTAVARATMRVVAHAHDPDSLVFNPDVEYILGQWQGDAGADQPRPWSELENFHHQSVQRFRNLQRALLGTSHALLLIPSAQMWSRARFDIGALLNVPFKYPTARTNGYTQAQTLFWVAAVDDNDAIVATRATCVVASDPPRRVRGFGDMVVSEGCSGHGLATTMTRLAITVALEDGPELLVTDTRPMAGVYERFGFTHRAGGLTFADGTNKYLWSRWTNNAEPSPLVLCHKF